MAEEQFQERTEQPTQKRLGEARDKGQIPRSRELTTLLVLLAAGLYFMMMGDRMIASLERLLRKYMVFDRKMVATPDAMMGQLIGSIGTVLVDFSPFILLMTVVAIAAPMLIGGWVFSPAAISFKFSKLDPIKGMGRIFSFKGLMELIKALLKFTVVLAVAVATMSYMANSYLHLGQQSVEQALSGSGSLLTVSFLVISGSLIIIAMADVPFQLWDYNKQLRMTRQEIKDEYKQTEGIPEVKRRIREAQRKISERRMMEQVPKADVIITNPTHYSVALKYDQDKMAAPVVVASGRDLIALQIRTVGKTHKVPIVSAPPLARAIYFSTDINKEIPSGLFLAVAKVLAFIYRLNAVQRLSGSIEIEELPIPNELMRD
ncbi:MAG: flagellar biosynthesis protein FlhB [Gammaproteobacteria bacterium]|nr:flagellar biosynthesis protein FlhB [Gammaproteobacteria bacterium]